MDKITVSKEQFNKLIKLQDEFTVNEPLYIQKTTAENIMAAKVLCKELSYELMKMQNLLDETETAFYDKEINTAIDLAPEYVHLAKEIKEYTLMIEDYLAGSISTLIAATEISSFVVTATSDEIQKVIDKNFKICPVMSIGFRDGNYALLFGEDEESIDIEPFIFGKGKAEDYEYAKQFIETFLDLEKVEE